MVSWNVTPCSLVDRHQRFGGICCNSLPSGRAVFAAVRTSNRIMQLGLKCLPAISVTLCMYGDCIKHDRAIVFTSFQNYRENHHISFLHSRRYSVQNTTKQYN
jgi:hypothetical protein